MCIQADKFNKSILWIFKSDTDLHVRVYFTFLILADTICNLEMFVEMVTFHAEETLRLIGRFVQ